MTRTDSINWLDKILAAGCGMDVASLHPDDQAVVIGLFEQAMHQEHTSERIERVFKTCADIPVMHVARVLSAIQGGKQ